MIGLIDTSREFIKKMQAKFPAVAFDYELINPGLNDEYICLLHNLSQPSDVFFEACYATLEETFYARGINNVSFSYDYEERIKIKFAVENIRYVQCNANISFNYENNIIQDIPVSKFMLSAA